MHLTGIPSFGNWTVLIASSWSEFDGPLIVLFVALREFWARQSNDFNERISVEARVMRSAFATRNSKEI